MTFDCMHHRPSPPHTTDHALIDECVADLYENAPCGYLSALPDGTLARVNRTLATWLGYRKDELIGDMRLQDLLTVPGKIYHETHYAPLLTMQGAVKEIAFDVVCRDGSRMPVLLNSVLTHDEAGRPMFNRTTVFDATHRRAYERELLLGRRLAEQAAQLKARYLAMLSHDVRNPLTSIQLAAACLERSIQTPDDRENIELLKTSANHVLNLVQEVLTYSKLEAGRAPLEQRPFDLSRLVREVSGSAELEASHKGLSFHVDIDPRVPSRLVGDATKLGQVLGNLLGNAVKFTEQGSVTLALVELERTPGAVHLECRVTDTGMGIAGDRLDDIFEEFTQARPGIAGSRGGSGLGLAICRRILDLHDTTMQVDSEPGRGTSFSFRVKLAIADE